MTLTIDLNENVLTGLQQKAQREHVSVEELALQILAASVELSQAESPVKVVTNVKAVPPDSARIRPAASSLAEALQAAPEDPDFNLDEWQRNWTSVEREMKAIARANDVAEGRVRAP